MDVAEALIELKVHARFKSLHRKLTKAERDQLEENIVKEEGCHDPIVVWRDFILDGHNRYEICNRRGLAFAVDRRADDYFPGEQAAVDWIIDLQLGRRNLSEQEMSFLRGQKVNNAPDGRTANCQNDKIQSQEEPLLKRDVVADVARQAGVSTSTVQRDAKRAKHVEKLADTIQGPYRSGDLRLTDAQLAALAKKGKQDQVKLARKVRTEGRDWNSVLGLHEGGTDAAAKSKTPPKANGKAASRNGSAVADAKDAGKPAVSFNDLKRWWGKFQDERQRLAEAKPSKLASKINDLMVAIDERIVEWEREKC
jgi:hypothetical protein